MPKLSEFGPFYGREPQNIRAHYPCQSVAPMGTYDRSNVMTMMNGLDSLDLEMMDEEFFGPPPRFLVEGHSGGSDSDGSEAVECSGVFSGFEKIRQLMGAW